MGMLVESGGWRNSILVDDAQGAEAHVVGIVVVGKREGEVGIEPTVICVAALGGRTDRQHCVTPCQYIMKSDARKRVAMHRNTGERLLQR